MCPFSWKHTHFMYCGLSLWRTDIFISTRTHVRVRVYQFICIHSQFKLSCPALHSLQCAWPREVLQMPFVSVQLYEYGINLINTTNKYLDLLPRSPCMSLPLYTIYIQVCIHVMSCCFAGRRLSWTRSIWRRGGLEWLKITFVQHSFGCALQYWPAGLLGRNRWDRYCPCISFLFLIWRKSEVIEHHALCL